MIRPKISRKFIEKRYSLQELQNIVKKHYGDNDKNLNLNSLSAIDFVVEVEKTFKVSIPDAKLPVIRSVDALHRAILSEMNLKKESSERYPTSEEFKRLEKLADLEKRILGQVSDVKSDEIPESIRKSIRLRGSSPVPRGAIDGMIDEGLEASTSHMHKHRIMMTPGEALYQALGKKDEGTYRTALSMTLGDILSMVTNRAAVGSTCAGKHMRIEDNDQPKHIRVIIGMRGMSPDILEKTAKDLLNTRNAMDNFQFIYSNGQKEKFGSKYVSENKANLQRMINDGVVIKVIKILSSGMKNTIYEKNASSEVEDLLYAELLAGLSA